MPSAFKKYLLGSLALHALIALLLYFSDAFVNPFPQATKITYVKLSYGDGGTNTKAATKKTDSLPAATIRDQREALKQLAKMKEPPKEKAEKLPDPGVNYGKEDAQPPDKKTVKIGGGQTKQPITKNLSKTDSALAKINDRLRVREQQFKQVDLGAAQSKGETGQSPWGGAEGNVIDPALVAYYNTIKRKITSQWMLSKDKYTGALVAQIAVLIDGSGHVVRSSFSKTSNDGSFNDSALRAVRGASPFPAPPVTIRDEVMSEGFLFTFNPKTVTGAIR